MTDRSPLPLKKGFFLAATAALFVIPWAIGHTGETNLPPLIPFVRHAILVLYAVWFLSHALFVSSSRISSETLQGWTWMAIIGVGLAFIHPVFSGDLMEYLIRGRMLAIYHISPYRAVPNDFPNDILRPYSIWISNPDAYGPLSVYIQTLPALIFQSSVMAMVWGYKVLVLAFWAVSVFYYWKIVQFLRPKDGVRLWALFAYSPLLVITALIDGHNDAIMMAFSVISMHYLLTRAFGRAFFFWTLAFLVKYMVVIQLPFMIVWMVQIKRKEEGRVPWRFLLTHAPLQMALTAALYAPLWAGMDTFLAILRHKEAFYTNTIPFLFYTVAGWLKIPLSQGLVKMFFLGSCIAGVLLLLHRCWKGPVGDARFLIRLIAGAYLLFYASLPSPLCYWYLCWALPWIILSEWPKSFTLVMVYSAVGALAFYKRINFLAALGALIYAAAFWREALSCLRRKEVS